MRFVLRTSGAPSDLNFLFADKFAENHVTSTGFLLIRSNRLDFSRLAVMRIELDHVFVCTAPGAPEAEEFVRFGLREGGAKSASRTRYIESSFCLRERHD